MVGALLAGEKGPSGRNFCCSDLYAGATSGHGSSGSLPGVRPFFLGFALRAGTGACPYKHGV